MKSSKRGTENNRGINHHMVTLHQRLYHALSLCFKSYDVKEKKWRCTDIEIQRLVMRSISAFLDCVSLETSNHPLVKDSVADMVLAVTEILKCKNGTMLRIAANVALKLVSTLPNLIQQFHVLDFVQPLSSLLSSDQVQAAVSCAGALNLILSNLSSKKEKEVWEILKGRETVSHIVNNVRNFSEGSKPVEFFQEMTSLLSSILLRWPPSRYHVWSDAKLMEVLEAVCRNPDYSVKVTVLKLYSALALCCNGANKILENGEAILQVMVLCMGRSHPHSIRMAGFKLAQHLTISEESCLKMMSLHCDAIVGAIVNGMSSWNLTSGKIPHQEISLLVEACRLALVTRWRGGHHTSFWKLGIDRVLVNLLLDNRQEIQQSPNYLSWNEQISKVQEGLNGNKFLVLRPYIWEILGWLAVHCGEDFHPDMHGDEFDTSILTILILCACLAFADSIGKGCQIHQDDIINSSAREASSRAVLMMIYSPCKYIASRTRFLLSEVLKPRGKVYVKYLLVDLNFTSSKEKFGMLDLLQTAINLMALTCYLGLPQYRKCVIKSEGQKTLLALMRWCLSNHVHMKRMSLSTDLYNTFSMRTCCWASKDWEGRDFLLLVILWGLAELMCHSRFVNKNKDILSSQIDNSEAQLIHKLQEICINADTYAPGPRWYAAYVLSFFGIFGFPGNFGKRTGKAINEKEYADIELVLSNGESFSVHGVFLIVRCPALLPPGELPGNEKIPNNTSSQEVAHDLCNKLRKEVRLSSHVDWQALVKLLEFIYTGYLQAEEELMKKLKIIAKHCNLQPLWQLLCRKSPKWGTPVPSFDLTLALGPAGSHFSDIVLEAKATDQLCQTCSVCYQLVPHIHVQKIILWASCDYLRALLQSGMQESQSNIIKVPVSWEALVKLVHWFYSDELLKPPSGCVWYNMDTEGKLQELLPYIELCWLADFWLLGSIQEDCFTLIVSGIASARILSVKVIQIAAKYSLWKLAEVAANFMAPIYHQLRDSGELEELDEDVVDLVRAASVRLSQNGANCQST